MAVLCVLMCRLAALRPTWRTWSTWLHPRRSWISGISSSPEQLSCTGADRNGHHSLNAHSSGCPCGGVLRHCCWPWGVLAQFRAHFLLLARAPFKPVRHSVSYWLLCATLPPFLPLPHGSDQCTIHAMKDGKPWDHAISLSSLQQYDNAVEMGAQAGLVWR